MNRILAMLIALAMLSACGEGGSGDNPISRGAEEEDADPGGGGDTGNEDTARIPVDIAKNLASVSFDQDTGTLLVEGIYLDDTPYEAVYTRAPALDRNGFQAYTKQDDALDRHATAYTATTATGARSTVAATGGPYNEYFTGVYYETSGTYSAPEVSDTTGLVAYVGRYVGLLNGSGSGEDLIPVAPGTPNEITPSQSAEVTGTVYMNADFADNRVEGSIYDREIVDTGQSLPSVVLVNTEITEAGAFTGSVEYSLQQTDPTWQGISDDTVGTYAGEFDGEDAQSIVGGVQLNQIDGPSNQLGFENELEFGAFTLEQCGTAGANDALCNQVNP
ncbi:thymidylate synthase [Roseivivax sp. CAU 1753]